MASISKENSEVYSWDLLWSFFLVALRNYRYDSVLRPFPPMYVDSITKEKNVEKLRKVAESTPPIKDMLNTDELSSEVVSLFQWITEPPNFKLEHLNLDQFEYILKLTKQEGSSCRPHHIFKVTHSPEREERFQNAKNGHKTLYAYHGSSLENFHSILHNGLAWHLSKDGLFGYGTYLSSEMSVSLHYSFGSSGWSKSMIGPRLSCIAVCEFVSDKCSTSYPAGSEDQALSTLNNLNRKLPEKYYIVQNNDLVQVRYLLIYSYGDMASKHSRQTWWRKHWMLIFCLSYIIVLVAIGLSKCPSIYSVINFLQR